MKQHYEFGECPDCGEDIPDNAQSGEECHNCGHVWNTVCDECGTEFKSFMKETGSTLEEVYGCPKCNLSCTE